jgi:hypothetical protein|tara:strand:- start:614 stop:808 length:195 start_codon:yes stop_codon:yes gene_type:complete
MRVDLMDLSKHVDTVSQDYKRLSKTQIRILSSQVPESFVARFKDEETALKELLDAIYGMYDHDS